ncbi:MAG TPA: hypothetical protein VGJ79_15405, partial [Candidatus Dormibacteraeota bacterium]
MSTAMARAKTAISWVTRRRRLAAAIAWRQIWANEGRVRALLWRDHYGFDFRRDPKGTPAVATTHGTAVAIASQAVARSSDLGVIAPANGDGSKEVLAEAG